MSHLLTPCFTATFILFLDGLREVWRLYFREKSEEGLSFPPKSFYRTHKLTGKRKRQSNGHKYSSIKDPDKSVSPKPWIREPMKTRDHSGERQTKLWQKKGSSFRRKYIKMAATITPAWDLCLSRGELLVEVSERKLGTWRIWRIFLLAGRKEERYIGKS